MNMWTVILIISLLASPTLAAFCDFVANKDCAFIADLLPVCGTNGKTYRNDCFLAKEYCRNGTIHKAHDGECPPATTTQDPIIHGSEVAFDIFCLDVSYIDCGTAGPTVCASDGEVYDNMCEFDKRRCFHRELHTAECS